MEYSQSDIEQLNSFERYLSFKKTWLYKRFIHMPNWIIFLCTGNQYGKSGGTARQYVDRILGYHPIPKKNMMYFECEEREKAVEQALENDEKYEPIHGFYIQKLQLPDGTIIEEVGHEKGTWSMGDKPKDDLCPYCGGKIIVHKRVSKKLRFCSQTLPGEKETIEGSDGESADVKNVVYPEFKKWLPSFLIRKDITFRSYAMIIKDPYAGQVLLRDEIYKGSDVIVDFVSYSQTIQSTAGQQRVSIWIDEECPKDFWDEQTPRLVAEDGDIILSLTPANRISWSFDDLLERASIFYRTEKICEALADEGEVLKMGEQTDFDTDIGVLQASTYDNPTINNSTIEKMLETIDDPDVRMTRLFGLHKQASGRVFKDFNYKIHVIKEQKYFPEGMYSGYKFARMIDYHEKNPWACTWIALSPHNEAFVWHEFSPSPEKMVTLEVSHRLASISDDFKYSVDLIDPLAEKKQSNTSTSVREDINRHFKEFIKDDMYPAFRGGFFQSWDTKSTIGRDAIRKRLKWSKQVGVPFNNKIKKEGTEKYVPTLWILDSCKEMAKSLKQWRYEEYGDRNSTVNKDSNEKVTQKFSHYPMCLEAIFKDRRFSPPPRDFNSLHRKTPKYMQGRTA